MTVIISGDQVVENVRQLAKDSSGFVYTAGRSFDSCYNYETDESGNPIPMSGCIVGRALEMAGADMLHIGQDDDVIGAIDHLWGDGEPNFTDEQVEWLSVVQAHQDTGYDWKTAVERADL